MRIRLTLLAAIAFLLLTPAAEAADFYFAGRSGDAVEIDFTSKANVPAGAVFSGLSTPGGHASLTSDALTGESFADSGKFWFFPNSLRQTPHQGDTNPDERGFQGKVFGTVMIDGVEKTYEIAVLPGHTGIGQARWGRASSRSAGTTTRCS